MFHRNHKSITNFKYFPQNKAHEFAKVLVHHTYARDGYACAKYIYIPFVCSFVCSFMCLPGTQRGDENPTAVAQTHKRCV